VLQNPVFIGHEGDQEGGGGGQGECNGSCVCGLASSLGVEDGAVCYKHVGAVFGLCAGGGK
jgi:hypothetical protein